MTGVQTCALPICLGLGRARGGAHPVDAALPVVAEVGAERGRGLAARFVSGYLYDEDKIDSGQTLQSGEKLVGGGATHAWLQIYLPGAGWVEYDPTNALIGGRNLIRVAVTRDPSQAVPVAGSFKGAPDAYQSMAVKVEITAE